MTRSCGTVRPSSHGSQPTSPFFPSFLSPFQQKHLALSPSGRRQPFGAGGALTRGVGVDGAQDPRRKRAGAAAPCTGTPRPLDLAATDLDGGGDSPLCGCTRSRCSYVCRPRLCCGGISVRSQPSLGSGPMVLDSAASQALMTLFFFLN
jgi:hypothetical protein